MTQTKKKTFFAFCLLIFSLSFFVWQADFAFGDLRLEYEYPQFSSGEELSVASQTTIGSTIKFYISWAIFICAVVALLVVIYAGISYLTSAGNVGKMQKAKERLFNSFLGLGVLLVAYLVLAIVNPQINVLRISKQQFGSGAVFLTKEATEKMIAGACPAVPTMIEEKQAFIVPQSKEDLTDSFLALRGMGPLFDKEATKEQVNFKDFELGAIAFWGDDANDYKVVVYEGKNFSGDKKEYLYSDVLLNDCGMKVKVFKFDEDFFKSEVEFDYQEGEAIKTATDSIQHPFLSVKIEGIGPGVYLFDKDGNQRYTKGDFLDFSLSHFNFNDVATDIEIRNKSRESFLSAERDYLAVIAEEKNMMGNKRIFFEKKNRSFLPWLVFEYEYYNGSKGPPMSLGQRFFNFLESFRKMRLLANWVILISHDDKKEEEHYLLSSEAKIGNKTLFDQSSKKFNTGDNVKVGNLPATEEKVGDQKTKIANTDFYGGNVKSPSSMRVFEIAPLNRTTCKEVRLCNAPYGSGYCLVFTASGKRDRPYERAFSLPMPWFFPVEIPYAVYGEMIENNQEYYAFDRFNDNIHSIYIDGGCLVVLYENTLKKESLYGKNADWDGGGSGEKTEIFTSSVPNLTNHNINTCGQVMGIGIKSNVSCASSIAVFPIW